MKLKCTLVSLVFGLIMVVASATIAQAQCDITSESRAGLPGHRMQADCYVSETFHTPAGWFDANGFKFYGVQPQTGRFLGGVVEAGPGTTSLENAEIGTQDLNPMDVCYNDGIFNSNALSGLVIRNNPNLLLKNVRVVDINFGPNVPCSEGIGIKVLNNTVASSLIRMENSRVDRFQRTGIYTEGNTVTDFYQSEIGKCTNEDIRNCYNAQIRGSSVFNCTNSRFTLNSNKSGFGNTASITLDYRTMGPRSTITNCQFRGGNTEIAINVFVNTTSPALDNNKIVETGADSPIPMDTAVLDRGFGMSVNNMQDEAKVRGFNVAFFHQYPVVHTLNSFMSESAFNMSVIEPDVH